MSGATRVKLRGLLRELGDLAEEVDPFGRDDDGALLFDHIAVLATKAVGQARDLETEAHNTASENGGRR
ncbi:hypothetical protein ACFVZ3_15425 [Kitasatospora purpeofusca]|uniref:hypothetical protein n=1 Tax=Kitasatospora purpeofusca TaxID=67352 RepID=UPI0004C225C7|nr:hypothetical protein [Kitasatospora purpeofusca]WSR40391.1 hypothetical protein OG196_15460 [Kitasatospora purpeofusca]